MGFLTPDWAVPANTLLLIILAIVQQRVARRAAAERGVLAKQVQTVAEHVADTRRVAKESHNDLVRVAEESVRILQKKEYESSPTHHVYRPRESE